MKYPRFGGARTIPSVSKNADGFVFTSFWPHVRQFTPKFSPGMQAREFYCAWSVKHGTAYMGVLKCSRNSSAFIVPNIHKFLLGMCQEEPEARKQP